MNILFYIEPWIEKARPEWKDVWIEAVLLPLYQAVQAFSEQRCYFLLGDAQRVTAERLLQRDGTQTGIITQPELRAIFPDYLTASLAWQHGTAPPAAQRAMQALLADKLQGFVPDIIISFMMPVPFLRVMFPQALVLHQEVGGFSRAPYPPAWHLDPCGMFAESFVSRFAAQIEAEPLTEQQKDFLTGFRQTFCDELLLAKNPFTRQELIGDKPLKHLLLLPLQISDYIAYEACCDYASQWDMLTQVLDNVRPDIGVVVTEHSDWGRMLTPAANAYLRRTYPNYIYSERFEDVEYPSQYLLPHVDAVATVSSSVGIQGLLWRKPVCALGKSHINAMADLTDIRQLGAYLDEAAYAGHDRLLHFLLTRYYFMGSGYLWHPAWLEARFRHWLAVCRQGSIAADFFPPADTDAVLLDAYRAAAQRHALGTSREQKREYELAAARAQMQTLHYELLNARAQWQAQQETKQHLRDELIAAQEQLQTAAQQWRQSQAANQQLQNELAGVQSQHQTEQQQRLLTQAALTLQQLDNQRLQDELADIQAQLYALKDSTSWRVTAPLRKIKDRMK